VCHNLCLIKCVIFVFSITKLGARIFQSVLQLGCGLDGGGIGVLSTVEALIFLFVSVSDWLWGPPTFLSIGLWDSFPGGRVARV